MGTKLIVLLGFAVAFAAGIVVGVQNHNLIPASISKQWMAHPDRHGWLVAELNLTPDQQQQLHDIWSDAFHRGGHENEDQRRELRKDRDDAISALIHPEDKPAYDQVMKNYSDQMSVLEQQWRGSFDSAVEKTKQILTPQQREKYEEILARNQWDRRPGDRATTRPASS
jgi:Spy/CpxP family protein refolding chaperone